MGYDGKANGFSDAGRCAVREERIPDTPLLLESFVAFSKRAFDLASAKQIGAKPRFIHWWRIITGEDFCAFRCARTRNGSVLQQAGERAAQRVMQEFNYVGVLAIDFECNGD